MSSAEFLLLEAFLIAAGIWFGRWMARQAPHRDTPRVPEHPDPYAMAWLTGDDRGVVRLATFDLLRHGYVDVDKEQRIRPLPPPADGAPIDPVAKGLYRTLTCALKVEPFYFTRLEAHAGLQQVLDGYRERWTALGLVTPPELKRRAWIITAWVAGSFVALAAARTIEAAVNARHNVGFLIALAILGCIAAAILIPLRRLTADGKRFLRQVRSAHDLDAAHARTWARQDQRGAAGDAMLLGVAVLGLGALSGTPWDPMRQAFGAGTGTGGSGCSSGSSCGSGSSCSGGGGCGGGGCGGGGD